jgi:NADPH:quinone reductase-like Zn-dependent oxidoreductase
MQAYRIETGAGEASLALVERQQPLGQDEVRVRVEAVALNYRDLMVADGQYLVEVGAAVTPCSDAAGEVVEVGSGVTAWRIGDRVTTTFFPDWHAGHVTPQATARAPGGNVDGVLAREIVVRAGALVRTPAHLDDVAASTLTCAGVTAWSALFTEGRLKAGDTALLLGTGGVSVWALQLARAAGVRTIVTSSSDAKLERARALGASHLINYRSTPEWQDEVLALTEGRGVQLVLEVGGQGTLARSLAATAYGGTVAVIGGVTGGFDSAIDLLGLIGRGRRLVGISVGSRAVHEELARFVEQHRIVPVVDRVFEFAEAAEAYRHLRAAGHFGKVVVRSAG